MSTRAARRVARIRRRRALRALRRRWSVTRYGVFDTPHGLHVIHEIPREAAA